MTLSPESIAGKLASQLQSLLVSRAANVQRAAGPPEVGPVVESVRSITMGAVTVRAAICRNDVHTLFDRLRSECFVRLEIPGPSNQGTQHIDLDAFQWRVLKQVFEGDVAMLLLRVMVLGVDSRFRWNGVGQRPENALLLHWQMTLEQARAWEKAHWDDLSEIEALCDAYEYNFLAYTYFGILGQSEAKLGYERLAKRRQELREKVAISGRGALAGNDSSALPAGKSEYVVSPQSTCTLEATLERALRNWDSASILLEVLITLRANLKAWSGQRPSVWRGEDLIGIIERRIADLECDGLAEEDRHRGRPAVPVWPREAEVSAAVAFSDQAFSCSEGVLGFMGYHVGHISTLTEGQRRRILDYVFLGPLPMVNGPDHMRSWGRPRTSTRLRTIARSLAKFARNARQQPIGDWGKAITEWENDLAYLKTKYFDRRARDWKWPKTVKRSKS